MSKLIESIIYSLKRQYPACIEIFQSLSGTPNYATGSKGETFRAVTVERAVVLPLSMSMEFLLRSIPPSLSANLGLGALQLEQSNFLVDALDLPDDWDFNVDGWLIYKNQKYSFNRISNLDGAFFISAKATAVASLKRELNVNVVDYMRLTSGPS